MEKTTVIEVPDTEMPKLQQMLEELTLQLRQSSEAYEARKPFLAARSAETEANLKQIGDNLAYVEEYLRTPLRDFCVQ
jgi:hypothetical protein